MNLVDLQSGAEEHAPHQAELDHLTQLHERVLRDGRGRVVVLHGPGAAGADALLTSWRRQLYRRREHVFEGDCLPGGAVYAPLAEIVGRYVRAVEDIGLMTDSLAELLSRLAPSLGLPRLAAQAGPPETSGEGASSPLVFYEALGRLFTELSEASPAVILLRDLHQADSATRAAVSYLAQNVVTDPVGSFAPIGLQAAGFRGVLVISVADESELLAALRRSLDSADAVTFLNLRGATEETVRRFLTRPDIVERFINSSGGETDNLQALIDTIPTNVEDLFLKRCERLDPLEWKLLGGLAVFGRPVGPDLLLHLVDRDVSPALLSRMFDKRVLQKRVHRGQLLIDLPSADNRRVVYQSLEPATRRALHGRIAGLIEDRARYGEPADLEELAFHYLRSDDQNQAVEYAVAAAERLHISYAYEQAAELLEAIWPRLTDTETRRAVLDRLIDLNSSMSRHRRALYYCGLLKRELSQKGRGPLYRRVAEILLEMGDYRRCLRSLDRSRAQIDETGPTALDEGVRLDVIAAEARYGQGQYDRVESVCDEALQTLSDSPLAEAQRQVLRLTNTLGKVYLFRGDFVKASRAFQENQRRAEEHNWPDEALQARFNLGTIALQRGTYAAAEAIFQECLSHDRAAQNPTTRARCLMNLGVVFHKTHRYDQALDAYLQALATFKRSGNDLQFAVVAMNLGALYQTIGDLGRARALIDTSLEVSSLRGITFYQGWAEYVMGEIALDEGTLDEAARRYDEAEATMRSLQSELWVQRIRVCKAKLAFRRGEYDESRALLDEVAVGDHGTDTRDVVARARLWTGHLLAQRGDTEGALAAFQGARQLAAQNGAQERLWQVDLALAELAAQADRTAEANAHVESAQAIIDEIGQQVPAALQEAYHTAPKRKRVSTLRERLRRPSQTATPVTSRAMAVPKGRAFTEWRARFQDIVGEDPRLLQVFRMVDKVADSDSTILIQGESGTGKELIAEAIHTNSERSDKPFVRVNCAAFVETLLLSELFGHEKGAFTGAMARKRGRFELADGGTLFLDEIGDISPNTQVALLRVLQERTFERVGGSSPIHVDVRVIVATNRNLEEMVRRGDFRLDLYYRLKGVILDLPPLRERHQDVVRLLHHFVTKYGTPGRPQRFSREALRFLARYSWPGNVRELKNFTRSIILFVDDPVIELPHVLQFEEFFADGEIAETLPDEFDTIFHSDGDATRPAETDEPVRHDQVVDVEPHPESDEPAAQQTGFRNPEEALLAWAVQEGLGLPELRKRLEIECIKHALTETGGNITQAAQLLDMKRPRLSQIVNGDDELCELKQRLVTS